jgi:hypothetical protein
MGGVSVQQSPAAVLSGYTMLFVLSFARHGFDAVRLINSLLGG